MKRTAIYIRVSSADQANSVETQEARIREYCAYKRGEFEICHVLIDQDTSGGIPFNKRESGSKLKKLIENGEIDCIIATKADRCFRNTVDALTTVAEWNDKNIGLILLDLGGMLVDTQTAAGEMVFSILIAFSQFERKRGGERTKDVLSNKKKNLKVYSAVPFGFKNIEGNLIPDETQQKAVELIKDMKAKDKSLRSICKQLNLMKIQTSKGGVWQPSSVKQILENPIHN